MANDGRATILLTINSNLEGIRKAQESLNDTLRATRSLGTELAQTSRQLSSFGTEFKSTLSAGVGLGAGFAAGAAAANLVLSAVRQLSGSVREFLTDGVRFNATLEQSALGVASVLLQFNPEKYRDFNVAVAASGIVIEELKKKALQTAATFEELLIAYQGTAGAMSSAGIPLQKQVGLIVNISQAMAALGIRTQEMRQEATTLLMGNIDRNARLAQTLGITAEHIRTAKEQGRLYEFLTDRLRAFADAGDLAQQNISVLESNLQDATTQVAAEQTVQLAGAYKELLQSLTDLVQSDAFKKVLFFLSQMTAGVVANVKAMVDAIAGTTGTPQQAARNRVLAKSSSEYQAFAERAKSVRTPEDIAAARAEGEQALRWMESLRRELLKGPATGRASGYADPAAFKAVSALIAATKTELALLEKEGALRMEINKRADEQAQLEALSANLAKDAQKAREAGAKELAKLDAAAKEKVLALAKETSPSYYIELLTTERERLMRALNGPQSKSAFYLSGKDFEDPTAVRQAEDAAAAFRANTTAKIADLEKDIQTTREAEAMKTQKANAQRLAAEMRLLDLKSQQGSWTERIAALNEMESKLDKSSLDYAQKKLEIEIERARINEAEAVRINEMNTRARERAVQASITAIREDRFLTEREKRQALFNAYKKEEEVLEARIRSTREYIATQTTGSSTRAQGEAELERLLTRRDVTLPQDIESTRETTWVEDMKESLSDLVDSFRTVGGLISDVIGTALNSVTQNISGLIMGTQTWGEALANVGATILNTVVTAIVQASVQWVARKIIEYALGNSLRAAALAANMGTALALSQIWATPATLATIATFGGAAIEAPAAITGAMGVVHGLAGFAEGGYTGPGGKYEIAGAVHRGEVVFSQADIARLGGVEAVERLRLSGGNYLGVTGRTTATGSSAPVTSEGGSGNIVQAFFNTREDAEAWLRTQRGRRVMTDFIKGESYDL